MRFDSSRGYKSKTMSPKTYKLTATTKIDKTSGYVYFLDKNHPLSCKTGKTYYHRHVASIKIGRWVKPNEVVHHINGVKTDNSLSNLKVMSSVEHAQHHAKENGQILLKDFNGNYKKSFCKFCNVEFEILYRNQKFCCKSCVSKYRAKDKRLQDKISKYDLEMLVQLYPITKIAKKLGYSDVTVIKLCKYYNIKRPRNGFWIKNDTINFINAAFDRRRA